MLKVLICPRIEDSMVISFDPRTTEDKCCICGSLILRAETAKMYVCVECVKEKRFLLDSDPDPDPE
jgi:hypothetical protein